MTTTITTADLDQRIALLDADLSKLDVELQERAFALVSGEPDAEEKLQSLNAAKAHKADERAFLMEAKAHAFRLEQQAEKARQAEEKAKQLAIVHSCASDLIDYASDVESIATAFSALRERIAASQRQMSLAARGAGLDHYNVVAGLASVLQDSIDEVFEPTKPMHLRRHWPGLRNSVLGGIRMLLPDYDFGRAGSDEIPVLAEDEI